MTNLYEPIHFNSVQSHLKHGDVVYDIGAYNGETSILCAEATGPEGVVIVEPAEVNWPSIRERWESKFSVAPLATFPGFLDRIAKPTWSADLHLQSFPPEATREKVDEERLEFRWLHYRDEDPAVEARPRMTVDLLALTTRPPTGFTMDVEGAEYLVLQGAERTLRETRPFVWISVHPHFMLERFGHKAEDLHRFMLEHDYSSECLYADHEEHFKFTPRERA